MVLENFCGHPFWDSEISWNTSNPVLSPCFTETALLWSASAFLYLLSPIAFYLASKSTKLKPINKSLFNCKLVLIIFLCLISVFELVEPLFFSNSINLLSPYRLYSSIIRLITFSLAGVLLCFYKRKGVTTSGVLFIFWSLMMLQSTFIWWTIFDAIYITKNSTRPWNFNKTDLIVKSSQLLSIFILWSLNWISDYSKSKDESPFCLSSFPGRILFIWYDSLAFLGYKRTLTESDIWNLPKENLTKHVQNKFTEILESTGKSSTLPDNDKNSSGSKLSRSNIIPVSLILSIFKCFPKLFICCAFYKLISCLLEFAKPIAMDVLLNFISSDEPSWHGYVLASGLSISLFLRSIIDAQYQFWIQTTSMRVKSVLIASVYQKSLRLSSSGRHDYSTGEIVNLMAVDIQRIVDSINSFNEIWSTPFQILISLVLTWHQLGSVSLAGYFALISLLPVTVYSQSKVKILQSKIMLEKDKRSRLMSEILNGIKILKLYAWEGAFNDMIIKIRQREIALLKRQAFWNALCSCISFITPITVSFVDFAVYILISPNNKLNVNKTFVSFSLIELIRGPVWFLPKTYANLTAAMISIKRLTKYLQTDELDKNIVSRDVDPEGSVIIRNGTFYWSNEAQPTLEKINLKVQTNQLIAIVGQVGSGKSSLLSALLGELHKKRGYVNVNGKIAYVPQNAWILNDSLRNNILFGKPFVKELYEKVVESCALNYDLRILPGGDLTEIGERGINLSGGQKQRVSLARAVYSDADIYLLDDPLSAVDAQVAKHLFDNVIGPDGILKNKIRILVTHRLSFLPQTDEIIVLKDGKILEHGTYSELIMKTSSFTYLMTMNENESDDTDSQDNIHLDGDKLHELRRDNNDEKETSAKLIAAETSATGKTNWKVYSDYFRLNGVKSMVMASLMIFLCSLFTFISSFWLSLWSEDANKQGNNNDIKLRILRIGVYGAIGLISSIFFSSGIKSLSYAFLNGAESIHNQMLDKTLRAPISFFDTTPIGRILNRFTNDIDIADVKNDFNFRFFVNNVSRILFSLLALCFLSKYLVLNVLIFPIIYLTIQNFYIASSRQLRRLTSVSISPIYSHFSESITGSTSIRAYSVGRRFIEECYSRIDNNNRFLWASLAASQWFTIRLEFFGTIIVTITTFYVTYARDSIRIGLIGLALSYAMMITKFFNLLMDYISQLENDIISIERCLEFMQVQSEAPWINENNKPDINWPYSGRITFTNYSTRYRNDLDLVLKNISCVIHPNEKIGVVGRTGAGKSSLTLALLRLIEPVTGTIDIDNQDISQLGLYDLRSRLSVIPQDPVLFSTNLRLNLDPFARHTDEDIWRVLEQSHLKDFIKSTSKGLDHEVSEGGENLSVGQRQLVCLARALLRKSKILILDEATAAVDVETDELIQKTIRNQFADCTIVTVAHRLNTVMDYNKIMVMNNGEIIEFDSPSNLIANENSIFHGMLKEAKLI